MPSDRRPCEIARPSSTLSPRSRHDELLATITSHDTTTHDCVLDVSQAFPICFRPRPDTTQRTNSVRTAGQSLLQLNRERTKS